jgi:Vacuolar protein sorting-associated protein 62
VRRLVILAAFVALLGVVPAAGGEPESSPSPRVLLARYAPVLVLHPAERFAPVPVDGFLADSDLQRRTANGWEQVGGPSPAGGADHRLDHRACRAVEGVAATPCYAASRAARGRPVAYAAGFRVGNRIALQYWLWYPFNAYSPTVPPGELWQVHEGDWESVSVIFDLRGKPLLAGVSQHSEGERRAWSRVEKAGARPRVYVALGSHANYFTAGKHRFDPRVVEPILITVIRQKGLEPVDRTGRGRVVRPRLVPVTAASPSWMTFAGAWGEDAYLRVPPSEPVRYGNGPPGPAFHEQWRKPVADVLEWPRG